MSVRTIYEACQDAELKAPERSVRTIYEACQDAELKVPEHSGVHGARLLTPWTAHLLSLHERGINFCLFFF